MVAEEKRNGLATGAIDWPAVPPLDASDVIRVQAEAEEVEDMPAAKKDDFLTTMAKQVVTGAVVGALSAGALLWNNSARAEERLVAVQRELSSARDDLKTESAKNDLNARKIAVLEANAKFAEQLALLNQNLETLLKKGRK